VVWFPGIDDSINIVQKHLFVLPTVELIEYIFEIIINDQCFFAKLLNFIQQILLSFNIFLFQLEMLLNRLLKNRLLLQ